jgi:hypothetical protein
MQGMAESGLLVCLCARLGQSLALAGLRYTGTRGHGISLVYADHQWNGYTPRIAFTLLYVLSIAIGKYSSSLPDELTV